MPINKTESCSVSTYQNFDGSNYTVAGVEEKFSTNRGYAAGFLGFGTDFNKKAGIVFDIKSGLNYDEQGIFNQNLRVRTKMGKGESIQVRFSPLSVDVPVGEKTNIYLNPHYSGQIDFKTNRWTNSAGVFAGVTQKFKNTSVSHEVQRYNLQDIKNNSPENWGINGIISYKF